MTIARSDDRPRTVHWKTMETRGGAVIIDDFAVVQRVEGCPDKVWETFMSILMENNDSDLIDLAYDLGWDDGFKTGKESKEVKLQ